MCVGGVCHPIRLLPTTRKADPRVPALQHGDLLAQRDAARELQLDYRRAPMASKSKRHSARATPPPSIQSCARRNMCKHSTLKTRLDLASRGRRVYVS